MCIFTNDRSLLRSVCEALATILGSSGFRRPPCIDALEEIMQHPDTQQPTASTIILVMPFN